MYCIELDYLHCANIDLSKHHYELLCGSLFNVGRMLPLPSNKNISESFSANIDFLPCANSESWQRSATNLI